MLDNFLQIPVNGRVIEDIDYRDVGSAAGVCDLARDSLKPALAAASEEELGAFRAKCAGDGRSDRAARTEITDRLSFKTGESFISPPL